MMMKAIALPGFVVVFSLAAFAQVEPAATGPARPTGNFNYSLHDSYSAWWSQALGNQQADSVSGIIGYTGGKSKRPLTVDYSGGFTFNLTGENYDSGYFQNLRLAETIGGRKWRLRLGDVIAFLPQAPNLGIAGILGVGDGTTPPPSGPSQTVLTENTHTISNQTTASYSIPVNFAITLTADGNYQILRYPNTDGLDTNAMYGGVGLTYRVDARTNFGGDFREARYSYSGSTISFNSTSLQASITHTWSKGFSTHASVGPNWVSASGTSAIPSSTSITFTGGVSYSKRYNTVAVTYYHGDNGGSGVFYGAQFNSLSATYSRQVEKKMVFSARFGYVEDSGLQAGSGSSSGIFAGATFARKIGRLFSLSASYLATEQNETGSVYGNAFSGLLQGITVSVGYAPKGMKNVGQR
jgi:hypothetical protein